MKAAPGKAVEAPGQVGFDDRGLRRRFVDQTMLLFGRSKNKLPAF
jgi:hypothetical protein